MRNILLSGAAIGSLIAITATPALAQDDETDTIIVTARKKEQTLQDAPLAITALGQVELQDGGFEDIFDVAKASPGLFVETVNGVPARVQTSPRFRGVTFDANSPLQRTGTIFIDGIIVTGGIQGIGVQELERVEVIKGPQSAIFGRNTFSGAINYITKDPSDEFHVDASWLAASRGEYRVGASVEGPILGDVLTGRLNASYDLDGGHYDNAAVPGQELGEETTWSVSGTALFKPNDNFRARVRAHYYEDNDGPAPVIRVAGFSEHNFGGFPIVNGIADTSAPFTGPPNAGDVTDGLFTESVFQGTVRTPTAAEIALNTGAADFNTFTTQALADGRGFNFIGLDFDDLDGFGLAREAFRVSFDSSYDFGNGISFDILAGYSDDEFLVASDFDGTGSGGFNVTTGQAAEDFSIEGRLSGTSLSDRLDWSLGVSYVDVDIQSVGSFRDQTLGFFFMDGFDLRSFDTAQTFGVFGVLDYKLTDQLTVIFEGRWQSDNISSQDVRESVPAGLPLFEDTFNTFLPRALIQYEPTDSTTLYANYSVGNLPGGFNTEVAELDALQLAELAQENPGVGISFGEERLKNYELGWKQTLADGRAAFNLAAFYMQRSDQIFSGFQLVTDTSPMPPNEFRTVAFTDNGATTDIFGVELDTRWSVTDDLTFQSSVAYINAQIDSFPEGSGAGDFSDVFGISSDPSGQRAARFPEWSGSFNATYERPISADKNWFARGDLFYTGSFFDEVTNLAEIPNAFDVNLRTGIKTDNWTVEIFVTNLLDEDTPSGANNLADTSTDVRFGSGFFDFSRESVHVFLRDRRQFGGRILLSF